MKSNKTKPITSFESLVQLFDVNLKLQNAFSSIVEVFHGTNVTPKHIESALKVSCSENDILPSTLGLDGFNHALCISVNDCIAHGFPKHESKVFQDTDIVTFDVTGYNGIYHSDMAHTFCKRPSNDQMRLMKATSDALQYAYRLCKPGRQVNELSKAIEHCAMNHGVFVVNGLSGHGIGKEVHMDPIIPNMQNKNNRYELKAGDVFTIEPLFALGTSNTKRDKIGAYYTEDGSIAAHYERCILVTDGGHVVLNKFMNL